MFMDKMNEIDIKKLNSLFSALYSADTYHPDPERMWKKIFAVRRLKGNSLAVAKRLAAWRELTAREQNLPRKWLLADQALVDIAKRFPESEDEFSAIDKISEKMARRYAEEWLQIIAELT